MIGCCPWDLCRSVPMVRDKSVSVKHHFSASIGKLHPVDDPSYSLQHWGGPTGEGPTPHATLAVELFPLRVEHTDQLR